jgi:hypothetical protein
MYLSDMEPAMKPTDAFAKHGAPRDRPRPDRRLEGRITSTLLTPYPPGIPLLIPGERFNATIVRYLRFARDFNERFPGFETDVHGLVKAIVGGKRSTRWTAFAEQSGRDSPRPARCKPVPAQPQRSAVGVSFLGTPAAAALSHRGAVSYRGTTGSPAEFSTRRTTPSSPTAVSSNLNR